MKWKRAILWLFAVFVALPAVLGIVGAVAVKQSPWVRRAILERVGGYVRESTGAQIAIRDFRLDLAPVGLELDGVVVRGRGPQSAAPLLQVEHIAVEFGIDSIFKREWHVQTLSIHHPVVHVFVDRANESNLPLPKGQAGNGVAPIFDVAIKRLLIDSGEVSFNDATIPLAADFEDFQLKAEFDRTVRKYHGVMGYGQGKIQYGRYAPVVHRLDTSFEVTPARISWDKLTVVAGQSRIVSHGAVENFNNPNIQAVYDAQLLSDDFAQVLRDAGLPDGAVRLAGSLTYQSRPGRSLVQNVRLDGELSSASLQIKTKAGRVDVRDLGAKYELVGGDATIRDIRARVLGGNLNASLSVRDVAGSSRARVQAHLRDISLERVEATAPQYSLPEAHLRGKVSADMDATWRRTFVDLVANADATMEGTLGENPPAPLTGDFHFTYTAASQEVELRRTYVRTPASSLELNGKVSRYSQLQVAARSNNLHELELLAANLRTMISRVPLPKLDLSGTASFSGSVTGSVTDAHLVGKLEGRDLRVKGSAWKLLRTNIDARPSLLRLSNGHLEAAPQGKIEFGLQTGLEKWAYTPASPLNLEISAAGIRSADINKWLPGKKYPVSGTLAGNVSIRGSQLSPSGRGEFSLVDGKIFSEPVQRLTLTVQGNGNAVEARMSGRFSAGEAHAEMTVDPKTQGYQLQMRADNIRLERLQTVKQNNLSIFGAFSLDAAGRGTLSSPQLTATVKVSQLRVQEQTIPGLTLAVCLQGQQAEITLNSEFAKTPLTGRGTVDLNPPYMADIRLDTPRFSFQPLLAIYAPAFAGEVRGQAELHASLRGPLQNKSLVEGHLDIPVLTASYQQLQLGVAKPVRVDYKDGVFLLQPVALTGTGTNIRLQATVPVNNPSAPSYKVEGTIDLDIARLLQPDLTGGGQIQIDLASSRADSDSIGELRVVNASFQGAGVPLGLDNGNGVVTVSRTRLQVKNFRGEVGGGTVTASGGVTFRPAIQFDIRTTGSDVRLRYPAGVRAILESNLTLVGNKQEATLSGTVRAQRVSLTREFDLGAFINQFAEQNQSVPSTGFASRIKLNVALQSASQMDVVSTQVSLRGSANLRLVRTVAEPVVLGRANLNGGDLFQGGNRFVLQSGAIDFVNPLRTEPIMNAQVKTKIDQYDITVTLQGPLERLRTNYTSDPALPPVDIINLLAFGPSREGTGGNPTTSVGNLGVQSALVQGLGSAVSNRVQKFAGLSYFSIDPALGGSNQNAGARVVIQQRVTSNLVVTYSTDVTSTRRQAIQLEYRLNPRWSVSGVRDQNGGFGATANYNKRF